MFIIFLFMCPCLWTCEFSSCISLNYTGFIDLHSATYFQLGCIVVIPYSGKILRENIEIVFIQKLMGK